MNIDHAAPQIPPPARAEVALVQAPAGPRARHVLTDSPITVAAGARRNQHPP
jgi:hypothetical protein